MRKSLRRTPHSGLSSRVAPLSDALRAAGRARESRPRVPRPLASSRRTNGSVGARSQALAAVGRNEQPGARVRLLEGFLGRREIADCAQFALQWLGDVLDVSRSICLLKPAGEQKLFYAA